TLRGFPSNKWVSRNGYLGSKLAGRLDELQRDVVGVEQVDGLGARVAAVSDLDGRGLEAHAASREIGIDAVEILHHERHVGVAGVAGARIAALPAGRAVLQQLDVVAGGAGP